MIKVIEGNIVFHDSIKYGQIHITNDIISNIVLDKEKFNSESEVIPNNCFISPGFIELQINGAFGKEFKTDKDSVQIVSDNLFKYGTTSFCPTVTTRQIDSYEEHLDNLISNFSYSGGTKFIGFHLEGPSLNPKKVGAQNADWIISPKELPIETYINKNVAIVTLAPELEGGAELIDELRKRGIKVGIGHSLISYEELKKIFNPKDMWTIHLFNAMDPLKSREPGVVGHGLIEPGFFGLIVDKIHLHPKTIEIIAKIKLNGIICISDGSAVTGLDPGTYRIGERTMIKTEKRVTLPSGTLVGSILTQNVAIKNLMEISGCEIFEAVNTVTYNPAKLLQMENVIGQLKKGSKADITVFDENFNIIKTIIDGKEAFKK